MRAHGQVEIARGLTIGTRESGPALAEGQKVMWRASSRALLIAPNGAHAGHIDSVELRRGERYVRVNIAGVRFDIASEDSHLREGTPCRIDIDPAGVTVWAA